MTDTKTYRCSTCRREVRIPAPPLPKLYPFCSERCKMVDLGRWFNEEYSIDRDLRPEDLRDVDLRDTDRGPLND